MRRHYLLTVLRLPGNVEAELAHLQRIVFSRTGAISSQALPPAVPLAGRELGGTGGHEASSTAPDPPVLPARLESPLVVREPHVRGRALCMDAGLAPGNEIEGTFPEGVREARLRVLLAVLPVGPLHACPGEPIWTADAGDSRSLVERLRDAWQESVERPALTVRRGWEEQWIVSTTTEPWWCSMDWRVTDRRVLRAARE